ncbi:MAG: response regulator [Candidatus Rokubacteria bacterium]|nr:response regulator [Candidatus Rokubacteria bacterium]
MAASRLLDRVHVLIVDEDPATCAVLADIVTAHGGVANVAASADRAVEFAAVVRPSVVVSDLRLGGGKSGVWLLDQFRGGGALASVPVIAMSAFAGDDALAGSLPFSAFVRKPVDPRELCALILGVVDRRAR